MSMSGSCWYGYCEDCRGPDCTCDCHGEDALDDFCPADDPYCWQPTPVATVRTVLDEPTVAEVVAEKRDADV